MKRFRVILRTGEVIFAWAGCIRECARNYPRYVRIERVGQVGR